MAQNNPISSYHDSYFYEMETNIYKVFQTTNSLNQYSIPNASASSLEQINLVERQVSHIFMSKVSDARFRKVCLIVYIF